MTYSNYDLKAAYKTVKMIFIALIAVPLVFLLAAIYVADSPAWQMVGARGVSVRSRLLKCGAGLHSVEVGWSAGGWEEPHS